MGQVNYSFTGFYDLSLFNTSFIAKFSKLPRYNPGAFPKMSTLVDLINHDSEIKDVRWAAYLLATVFWETTSPTPIQVVVKNRKGQPVMKDGKPLTITQKPWLMTMAPVEEVGHGKKHGYYEPVKVAALDDGGARVTEQDGDQWSISATGAITALNKRAVLGSAYEGPISKRYTDDDGDENAYFGRGYVQLTWWSNYAKSSAALGRGLELLFNPELVLDPPTAYALMSHGMRTGFGFANGKKFADFFSGNNKKYVEARAMVNGVNHDKDIAKLAEAFESVLLDSRAWVATPPAFADGLEGAPSRYR